MRLATRFAALAAFALTAHAAHAAVVENTWVATLTVTGDITLGDQTGVDYNAFHSGHYLPGNTDNYDYNYGDARAALSTVGNANGVQFSFYNGVSASDFQVNGGLNQWVHVGAGGGTVTLNYSYVGQSLNGRFGYITNDSSLSLNDPVGYGYQFARYYLDKKGNAFNTTGEWSLDFAAGQAHDQSLTLSWSSSLWNRDDTPPVPEPETWALMGLGLVGLLASRRKRG